ncbi:MAG: carboxymuconolactone decarboxylase family protein [Dehalococcoidia bacterium]
MADEQIPEAWVQMPDRDEFLARVRQLGEGHPYDFGFFPAMARLIMAHGRLGPPLAQLFGQIMFAPEGHLDRRERELVAAVASAGQDCHY